MKIAIPSEEGTFIAGHFGRARGFAIFEVADGRITGYQYRANDFTGHALGQHHEHHHGDGHDDHAYHSHNRILSALHDCETVIAGGMGRRLVDDLNAAGMKIFITSQTETRKAVELFLKNELDSDRDACCHHE